MSSKVSMPPNIECLMENGTNIFNMMNDQYTLDYLRNIFGKYLVYMARRKEKKGRIWGILKYKPNEILV